MELELVGESRCFEGRQITYKHRSDVCDCTMRFAAFLPPAAARGPVPALYWLSGLTCTEENFSVKAGAQRYAAALGLALIIPDTSPRGVDIPGENDAMDVGTGAGFYVNATQAPWAAHYRMYDYIRDELVGVVNANLPVDPAAQVDQRPLDGRAWRADHRRRNPDRYRSVSAFSPIYPRAKSAWGQHALADLSRLEPRRLACLRRGGCDSRGAEQARAARRSGRRRPVSRSAQAGRAKEACRASGKRSAFATARATITAITSSAPSSRSICAFTPSAWLSRHAGARR